MTRLMPSSTRWRLATSYPSRRPASAFVEPSGSSVSMAARIRERSVAARRFEDGPRVGPEDHDRHGVVRLELIHEELQRLLDQPQAILAGHGARDVDDERERGPGSLAVGHGPGLDADPDELLAARQERGGPAVCLDREGPVLGRRIALVEVVDELLWPDAGRVGQVTVGDESSRDRVRGGVDVERERRDAVLGGIDVGIDARVLERHAVVRGAGGHGRRRWLMVLAHRRAASLRTRRGRRRAGRHGGDDRSQEDEGRCAAHGDTSLRERAGIPADLGPTAIEIGGGRSRIGATGGCAVGPSRRRRTCRDGSACARRPVRSPVGYSGSWAAGRARRPSRRRQPGH